ncbi:BON domain-containing protein [Chitinivorax sp. PXF-14]|uniref:BON domain-containing protein n=1 Tax=Chitinivorax sp. PXF-14 TaxID=3230488 RepID=UPI0034674F54
MNKKLILLMTALAAAPAMQACAPLVVGAAAGTALMANDRRTTGTQIDDQNIELKISARLKEQFGDRAHIDPVSFNRALLLVGEVANEQIKQDAERIARTVPSVSKIYNELVVGPVTTLGERATDAGISTKVKANLIGNNQINANQIKVTTEGGIVYLMGIVTHFEAKAAADTTAGVSGVKKVVTLFEYLD